MDAIVAQFVKLWGNAQAVWISGGWCMPGMALNALVLFGLALHLYGRLREKGFQSVPEKTWRRWIDHPEERKGPVGELLDFVSTDAPIKDSTLLFHEMRATEIAPIERDLWLMRVCVSAPPLIGLLGTVTGILTLFGALAKGSGGEETVTLVAGGISEAMIATETGLVIAIPGLFIHYYLSRKFERYQTFLAHLETVHAQTLYRRLKEQKLATHSPPTGRDAAAASAEPAQGVA